MKINALFTCSILVLLTSACDLAERGAVGALDKALQSETGGGIAEAMGQFEELSTELNDGQAVNVVSHRDLKKHLPERVDGRALRDSEGTTTGFGSLKMSLVSAEYGSGRERIEVQITDGGALGLMAFTNAGWLHLDMDQESADGSYERTVELDGYRGYEQYQASPQRSELMLVIGERFLVSLSGRGVGMEALRAALRGMDLAGLARLG